MNNKLITVEQLGRFLSNLKEKYIDKINLVDITYNELVKFRNNSMLVPGQQYRITDYITTTVQENTQSAGHQFDVIVIADSENTLNEEARACIHDGDTYFSEAGANLTAWKIWYCIDNDTDRFAWADTNNGKGVIYRMIDEWNNECPYDFKNIKFHHDGLGTDAYTFTWIDENYEVMDTSIFGNNGTLTYHGEIYGVYGNVIKPYIKITYNEDDYYLGTKQLLNNITFISDYEFEGSGNDGFYGCTDNSFGNNCRSNSFGNSCDSNSFGNYCYNNNFGNNCYSNSFGNNCYYNSFDNDCKYNSFGNNCYSNSFGDGCYRNSFGNYCQNNKLIYDCNSNSFENNCYKNSLYDGCIFNSFGDGCYSNVLSGWSESNSFGNYCYSNSFDENCYSNSFGNKCHHNSFGQGCNSNSFGNSCSSNRFDENCYNNSFGNECGSNIFGIDCDSNCFGNECSSNSFGDVYRNNSFGNGCDYNSFRTSTSITANLLDYCYYNHFDDGCSYNVIWNSNTTGSSNKLQNININRGVSGTSSNYNFINVDTLSAGYEIQVAKNTKGDIKVYCEADLIA